MAYTDYPITELGDVPGEIAPIRECFPIHYDGDKYWTVEVGGVSKDIKAAYIYTTECRCGEGEVFPQPKDD